MQTYYHRCDWWGLFNLLQQSSESLWGTIAQILSNEKISDLDFFWSDNLKQSFQRFVKKIISMVYKLRSPFYKKKSND